MTSRRAKRRREVARRVPARVGLARVAGGVDVDQEATTDEAVNLAGLPAGGEERARALEAILQRPSSHRLVGWGWPAFNLVRQVEVPERLRRGVALGAGRPGECYEQAAAYVARHQDQPVRLAHAWVFEHGMPWLHSFALLDKQTAIFDPTTGRYYDADSFAEVLQTRVLCRHEPAEVVALLARHGTAWPWPGCWDRNHQLLTRLVGELDRQHPGLLAWVDRMCATDPGFAAAWWQETTRGALSILHVLGGLAVHPERWQDHQPGQAWRWPLHPLRELGLTPVDLQEA